MKVTTVVVLDWDRNILTVVPCVGVTEQQALRLAKRSLIGDPNAEDYSYHVTTADAETMP